MRKTLLLAATLALAPPLWAADGALVPYPEGYRQWTHVKSMMIMPEHALYGAFGGMHHLCANRRAAQKNRDFVFSGFRR
jgi:hypothetical protein